MALEFQINLGGNFVDALDKSQRGLEGTEKHTKNAEKALEAFELELGKVGRGALSLNFNAFQEGGHFLQFDLAEGASMAFEAVSKVVEKISDLAGEMIHAAGAAEDLNLAIKLDVGDEGGEKVDKLAESFAGTRFSAKTIKESLLPILEESGDEHADQWDDLVTAATDVATRRNTGQAGARSALEALRGIEIMPQKVRGSLKELGIKQKDFYDDLGDLLGISAAAAEKQTKAGKIKADTLLSVALHQIAEREGGSLGNATNEGAKTLGSSLERLGNLKDTIFERLAGSNGMRAVQGFLDNFSDTLEGPIGTDLVAKVGGAFETLFGDLSGPTGLKKMEDVVGGIANRVGEFVDDFRGAWPDIKSGAEGVWEVMKGIGETVATVVKGWREISEFMHQWDSGRIQKDIVDTIKGDHGGIAGDAVNENSPAWKIAKAAAGELPGQGGMAPIDFSQVPHLADGGIVSSPTFALIGEAGPEAVIPLRGGRGLGGAGGGSISIGDVVVNGGSSSDGYELGQLIRIEVKKILDEAAATFGEAA